MQKFHGAKVIGAPFPGNESSQGAKVLFVDFSLPGMKMLQNRKSIFSYQVLLFSLLTLLQVMCILTCGIAIGIVLHFSRLDWSLWDLAAYSLGSPPHSLVLTEWSTDGCIIYLALAVRQSRFSDTQVRRLFLLFMQFFITDRFVFYHWLFCCDYCYDLGY